MRSRPQSWVYSADCQLAGTPNWPVSWYCAWTMPGSATADSVEQASNERRLSALS